MIYITGGCQTGYKKILTMASQLTTDDMIIVLGNFGIVYDKSLENNIPLLTALPCDIGFIDGPFENFDRLKEFPIETYNKNTPARRIASNIWYFMRNQIYEIQGHKIFCLGGAEREFCPVYSVPPDIELLGDPYYVLGESWWKDSVVSSIEYEQAARIVTNSIKLDYIFSCYRLQPLADILKHVNYKKWFIGNPLLTSSIKLESNEFVLGDRWSVINNI